MHRQHPALIAVQTVRGSVPGTSQSLPTPRSSLATPRLAGLSLLGLLLAFSGCYGPYQSPAGGFGSPYGFPPSGMPTQTLQPGGTYTPSPYGQPASPYGTFQPTVPGQPSTISPTGGDAPFYNSGSVSQPYDGGGVPTYSDPNEVQFQQPIQPDNTAIDSYGAVEGASAAMASAAKVDLDTANFVVSESNFDLPAAQAAVPAQPATTLVEATPTLVEAAPAVAEDFQPPREFEAPAQFDTAAVEAASAPQFEVPQTHEFSAAPVRAAEPSPLPFPGEATPLPVSTTLEPNAPFAHDAEFSWLRGVLRFDASSGVWTMIYSDNPSEADEHGGKLLVADSPLLEQFKPQAIVLLRGEIDAQQSASAGRAVFRADVIEPVELSGP